MRRRVRRVAAIVAGLGLVVAGLGVAVVEQQPASAVPAVNATSGFNPADIIDDSVMFNGSTMSASDIQAFLDAQQPTCAPGATCLKSVTANMPSLPGNYMCGPLAGQQNATAAQIIAAVGRACNVNPQVILVMLQKEQTLVTGRMPYSGETVSLIYRKATGLGCPDSSACDPSKYGLFNQLYGVAYWLVRYTTPPGTTGPGWTSYNWFPVGSPSGVLYNPDPSCGASTITIRNKATAALYYYTPYQPDSAALAAGWGLGDGCSAYGNRNFYLYFTTWFGSTHLAVTGAIATWWNAHRDAFGGPLANAVVTSASGGGTSQRFQNGTIFTSASGTYGLTGAVLAEYTAAGGPGGPLGWPRRGAAVRGGSNPGSAQNFQNGAVYVTKTASAAVTGPVYAEYRANGYETGRLGWPTGEAVTSSASGGGVRQDFQGGRVTVAGGVSTTVTGDVLAFYLRRGGESGQLGWPTGDVGTVTARGLTGLLQPFQSGTITVQAGTVRTVTGWMGRNYLGLGGPTGRFGWPTSAAIGSNANGGGWYQRFQGGQIFYNAAVRDHALVNSSILSLYEARGGTEGTLGWLTRSGNDRAGITGTFGVFTNGTVYASRRGTYAVLGAILQRYLQGGGTRSSLGWPVSNAYGSHGAVVQRFEHGSISWTQAGGAKVSRS